jgi:hypothetical protein
VRAYLGDYKGHRVGTRLGRQQGLGHRDHRSGTGWSGQQELQVRAWLGSWTGELRVCGQGEGTMDHGPAMVEGSSWGHGLVPCMAELSAHIAGSNVFGGANHGHVKVQFTITSPSLETPQ